LQQPAKLGATQNPTHKSPTRTSTAT